VIVAGYRCHASSPEDRRGCSRNEAITFRAVGRGLVLAAAVALGPAAAAHEGGGVNNSLFRDTEIEGDIHRMMTPIWQAAGRSRCCACLFGI
jgi:hypothetical protein